MEESEEADTVGPLVSAELGLDPSVACEVLAAKMGDPSAFVSYWEADEQDIQEATEEEIRADPVKRILWAAEMGHVDVLREMLGEDGKLVDGRDGDGYQPLHRASYENHTEAMKELMQFGAEVNSVTHDGWTPLHSASRWGQTLAASLLLQNGADVNQQTNGGLTPLHLAACNAETKDILELLLMQEDVDISLTNKLGETARELCERANPFGYLFDLRSDAVNVLGNKS